MSLCESSSARHSPPQLPAGGDRCRPHASAQAQGAQDHGTGEQEVEEPPDGNGVGGVQDVCCCCKAAYFVIMLLLVCWCCEEPGLCLLRTCYYVGCCMQLIIYPYSTILCWPYFIFSIYYAGVNLYGPEGVLDLLPYWAKNEGQKAQIIKERQK